MERTFIQAKVTKVAAFAGADVDISGIKNADASIPDWTLHLRVSAMKPGNAILSFTYSVDNFVTTLPGPVFSVVGPLVSYQAGPMEFKRSFQKRDFPQIPFGVAGAELRCNLVEVTGADPSITYQSYLEY